MESILSTELYTLCAVIMALLAGWTGRGGIQSTRERWLRRLLVCFVCYDVFAALYALFCGFAAEKTGTAGFVRVWLTLRETALILGVFCWCGHVEAILQSGAFENKASRRTLHLLVILMLVLPALNLFTGWMFETEGGVCRGRLLYFAEILILLAMSAVCAVRLVRHTGKESDPDRKRHLYETAALPLCLLAALVLALTGEPVPITGVCILLVLLCASMGTMRDQVSLDPLTQVNNRQNLMGFLDFKLKNNGGDLYLLMLDLDDFKAINDTYGHLAGDRALTRIASALKRTCGPLTHRPYIARYGGDEFIVILEGTEDDVRSVCDKVRAMLSETDGREIPLSVSVGSARWKPGMDAKALIADADAQLYRRKEDRKR